MIARVLKVSSICSVLYTLFMIETFDLPPLKNEKEENPYKEDITKIVVPIIFIYFTILLVNFIDQGYYRAALAIVNALGVVLLILKNKWIRYFAIALETVSMILMLYFGFYLKII